MANPSKKTTSLSELWEAEPKEPVVLDRSTLELVASCPQQAWLIREKGIPTANILTESGTIAHEVISECMETIPDGEHHDMYETLMALAQMNERTDLQPDVIMAIRGLAFRFREMNISRVLSVEQQYSWEIMGGNDKRGPVLATCRMDLVQRSREEDTLIVTDWKTGWKQRDNSQAKNAYQTCHNSWVLFQNYPQVNKIHWFYEQTRTNTRAYALIDREKDFHNFEGRISMATQAYMNLDDRHPAWPYPENCQRCPAAQFCEKATREARLVDDDPPEYLAQYIAKQGELVQMEDAMKDYCKEHPEGIQYGDSWYGFKPSAPRRSYKIHELAQAKD
mgnify:CR=1 FL=1|tara:strand:- start:8814 stop:9818 length:1005 start_codon:yes stop_codon:yes gene_type:complete